MTRQEDGAYAGFDRAELTSRSGGKADAARQIRVRALTSTLFPNSGSWMRAVPHGARLAKVGTSAHVMLTSLAIAAVLACAARTGAEAVGNQRRHAIAPGTSKSSGLHADSRLRACARRSTATRRWCWLMCPGPRARWAGSADMPSPPALQKSPVCMWAHVCIVESGAVWLRAAGDGGRRRDGCGGAPAGRRGHICWLRRRRAATGRRRGRRLVRAQHPAAAGRARVVCQLSHFDSAPFIGYGSAVRRPAIAAAANWYVLSIQPLLDALK